MLNTQSLVQYDFCCVQIKTWQCAEQLNWLSCVSTQQLGERSTVFLISYLCIVTQNYFTITILPTYLTTLVPWKYGTFFGTDFTWFLFNSVEVRTVVDWLADSKSFLSCPWEATQDLEISEAVRWDTQHLSL